jgi:peptide/nickel transport system substrate-binding protein
MQFMRPVLLLLLAVGVAGCAGPSSPQTNRPDGERSAAPKRVRAAIQGEPRTLSRTMNGNVGRVRGVNELELLVHAGLSVENDEGDRRPQLAEAVPSIENGLWKLLPDGRMETTWKIRDGTSWHDGTPFTAADLAFTATVGQDKDLAIFTHPGFDAVESVRAADPRTVLVSWRRPFFGADLMFTSQDTFAMPLPRHLLEQAYLDDRAGFSDLPYWTSAFVGAGPFKVRDYVVGSRLTLQANDSYPLGKPRIDEIEVRFISDLNTLVANLLAGEIELTIGRSLSAENAFQLRDRWTDGTVLTQPGDSWTALYPQHLNPSPPAIGDPRFRRALMHASDRQELVDELQHSLTVVAHSMISPNRREYRDIEQSIVRYEYDPRRTAQMLDEQGFTRGADGFYRDGGGQRLSIEVRSTGGDDFRDKELLSITDQWQRAGIGTEPVFIPRQRANDREYRVTRPAFEVVSQGTTASDLENLHTRTVPSAETRWVGANRGRYSNPEFDTVIDRFFVTVPRAERMGVLGQIIRHMTDQLVVMGLYFTPDATGVSNRLRNVPAGSPWNAHEWDVA